MTRSAIVVSLRRGFPRENDISRPRPFFGDRSLVEFQNPEREVANSSRDWYSDNIWRFNRFVNLDYCYLDYYCGWFFVLFDGLVDIVFQFLWRN